VGDAGSESARIEEQAAEAIRRALPAEYIAEIEGRGSGWEEARKRRKEEGTFGLEGYEAPDDVWYASEKAKLAAPEERMMLESGGADEEDEGPVQLGDFAKAAPPEQSGILTGSTLKALKGYGAGAGGQKSAPDKAGGPLVGYGSDDESD